MDVMDAAYDTVHDYAGGSESLAPRVDMNARVLRNKVDPKCETHHLSLNEARRIMARTRDHRMLYALNDELGYLPPIPRIPFDEVSDLALLESFTKLMAKVGEFSGVFHTSIADNRITQAEIDVLTIDLRAFQAAGEELLARTRAIIDR